MKGPVSHFWLGLAFSGHDSDCLFAEKRREGTREGERGSGEREIAYAQQRGVFPPSASGTIPAKLWGDERQGILIYILIRLSWWQMQSTSNFPI